MASFRFLSTRERTSHRMRFYNHSLGMISPHLFWVYICKLTLGVSDFTVSPLFPKCSSSEGRPFRLGTGANMEKVVKMDRDMTKVT